MKKDEWPPCPDCGASVFWDNITGLLMCMNPLCH